MEAITYRLEQFEGPLDLLLTLFQRHIRILQILQNDLRTSWLTPANVLQLLTYHPRCGVLLPLLQLGDFFENVHI